MLNEDFRNDYTLTLLTKLWIENPVMKYSTLDTFVNNLLYNKKYNLTVDQVSDFVDSITRNFEVIMMRKKNEIINPKTYIVNGFELKKEYYSLRTEAPKILRESAASLNSKANNGIIKLLPGFKTKKISAEEIYRYYSEQL